MKNRLQHHRAARASAQRSREDANSEKDPRTRHELDAIALAEEQEADSAEADIELLESVITDLTAALNNVRRLSTKTRDSSIGVTHLEDALLRFHHDLGTPTSELSPS